MKRRSIITQLLGGLGNQMFQYAAARRIAHDHGLELLVDDSILIDHRPGRHAINRSYDLDVFNIDVARATRIQRLWFNPHGLSIPEKLAHRALRGLMRGRGYREKSFRFDEALIRLPVPPAYLSGLWQSYKYFEPINDLIRTDFSFKEPIQASSLALMESLKRPTSVCLNVRRGDYVSVSDTANSLGFVGLEYYHAAAAMVRDRLGSDVRYFVFSDDVEWCRRELGWLDNGPEFVEHSHAGPKFSNYLQLMSLGSHFVIPNSTFAWWAAWLSRSATKLVVAPKQWFRDTKLDSSDLCPPDWIRV